MNFKIRRTVCIQADLDSIHKAVTNRRFEQDFLPEIVRNPATEATASPSPTESDLVWNRGPGVDIGLVRKDLNVTIDRIEFQLLQCSRGVLVSVLVEYHKPFEKHFIKAHKAIRALFSLKLQVLKQDLDSEELNFALT